MHKPSEAKQIRSPKVDPLRISVFPPVFNKTVWFVILESQ